MITSINEFRKIVENTAITYKIDDTSDEDGDIIYFSAHTKGMDIARCTIEKCSAAYYLFEDSFSEEEYNQYFPKDKLLNIQELKVDALYRNQGIAKKLIQLVIEKAKQIKYYQLYLNACAITYYQGLSQEDLVGFYESLGFKVILDQGNNALMYLNLQN